MVLTVPQQQADEERHLPYGRYIDLPQRGTTFVRHLAGPDGAPTLLLLHGWMASAGLNWYQTFKPLAERFNVLAPDLRGHARGLRTRDIFRLADCADDCAATIEQLNSGPVIAVGYSMGGPVAQLFWRRHRDLVDGLVLCATTAGFVPDRTMRRAYQAWMLGWMAVARTAALVPGSPPLRTVPVPRTLTGWAGAEFRRHNWRMIVEAGHSLSTYHASWIRDVDVPTAVVCTTEDRRVPPELQLASAEAIRGATVHSIADGHFACANPRFASTLLGACSDVAGRVA